MKKILAIVLSLVLSLYLIGCEKITTTTNNGTTQSAQTTAQGGSTAKTNVTTQKLDVITPDGQYDDLTILGDVEGTIHERSITETSKKLLDNGTCDYKYIQSSSALQFAKQAPTEFNTFFSEATGKTIKEATDKEYSDSDKIISIGETNFLQTSGLVYSYDDIKSTGYLILTKGNSIFVIGQDKGILNGIYDLLKVLVNYEQITDKAYTLNTDVKDIPFYEINIKEVPDIEYAIAPFGNLFYNLSAAHRCRCYHDTEYYIDKCQSHSSFTIVPTTFIDTHPAWFSNDHQQLCYTAHGNASEYEALITQSVNKCIELIKADTKHNVINISQQDINVWCSCEACNALYLKYKTNAASHIIYLNDVASRVQEIIDQSEDPDLKGRKITFEMFAYHKTEIAPTTRNNDGTYTPIDEDIILADNVAIQVAPIGADFMSGVLADNNTSLKNVFLSWQPIVKTYSAWTYDVYFGNYLVPFNSWNAISDMMKFLVQLNCVHAFVQGAWNLKQPTNFDKLKAYLYTQLQWDCNQNVDELVDKYFDAVYKDASDAMKQAYLQMRVQLDLQNELGLDGSVWTSSMTTRYFPKRYLMNQLETFDEAFAIIEQYKDTDPDLYQSLYDSINLETIGVRYILINLYIGTFSELEQSEIISSFISDVDYLNVDRIGEGISMEDFIKQIQK